MDITPTNDKHKNNRKKLNFSAKQKTTGVVVFVCLLLVTGMLVGMYKYAYSKGYKNGEIAGKKATKSNNAEDIFGKIQNPFNTIVGKVEKLEGDNLTITTNKGEKQEIKITKDTKITKKTDTLKRDDLTKGTNITIFTKGKNSDVTATRIVVR